MAIISRELIPRRCHMKIGPCARALWFFLLGCFVLATNGSAAESSGALLKAKKEAEAKGYIFESSRDEIVAKAKKEGAVKVLSGLDPSIYSSMMESFRKKYPFLKIEMVEISGPDSAQRFIMELKSGSRNDFDIAHASTEFYPEYIPFAKKFDLLGMAEFGVLRIPPKMVDPKQRTLAAVGSAVSVVAYNKDLIPPDKVPNRWEDFLKPEFKGRKFMVDMRPHPFRRLSGLPARGPWFGVDVEVRKGLARPKPDLVPRPQQGFELDTGRRICHSLRNTLSVCHESNGEGSDRQASSSRWSSRCPCGSPVGAGARLGAASLRGAVVHRA